MTDEPAEIADEDARLDALAAAAAQGDRSAFRDLVVAVHDEIRLTIAWRVGLPDLVDDCLQETLLAAYRDLPRYRCDGSLRAWLKGIARHRCLAALRQRRRRLARQQPAWDAALIDRLADEAATAGDDERLPALRRCLAGLAPEARRLIQARYLEGVSLDDLTRRLAKSKGAIAGLLHRIRERLAHCIRQELAP